MLRNLLKWHTIKLIKDKMQLRTFLARFVENTQVSNSVALYSPEDNLAVFGNAIFGSFHGELSLPAQLSSMWKYIQEQSPIINAVLLVNIAFFIMWRIFPVLMERHAAVSNMNWREGRWWSIILSAFSHRDLVHIMGNMSFFLTIGSFLQKEVGNMVFASTLLLSPIVSGGCTLLYRHCLAMIFPKINRFQNTLYATTIGFSGVVSAMACLYTYINPSLRVRYMYVNRHTTLYDLFTYWLWFDVFGIAVSTFFFSTGISHTSHLGGVATGLMIRQILIMMGTSGQVVSKQTLQLLSRELRRPVEVPSLSSRIFGCLRRIVCAPSSVIRGKGKPVSLSRCW
ncbi:rhomboid family intramembrane serine protease [archaeon]|nr:MAG: rhomboid family intramembrane serine protease [archaeon]